MSERALEERAGKRDGTYEPPKLIALGSLAELTRQNEVTIGDSQK